MKETLLLCLATITCAIAFARPEDTARTAVVAPPAAVTPQPAVVSHCVVPCDAQSSQMRKEKSTAAVSSPAAVKSPVDGVSGRAMTPDAAVAPSCPNPNCTCEDCQCDPCECVHPFLKGAVFCRRTHKWFTADGRYMASPGSSNWEPAGRYETRCMGGFCKRIWVPIRPTPDLAQPPAQMQVQPADRAARPDRSIFAPIGRAKWQPRHRLR